MFEQSLVVLSMIGMVALSVLFYFGAKKSVDAFSSLLREQREEEGRRIREAAKLYDDMAVYQRDQYENYRERAFQLVESMKTNQDRLVQQVLDAKARRPSGKSAAKPDPTPSRNGSRLPKEPQFASHFENAE